ncbi:MAG TPA: exodeoxyribonuclease I [Candidatus Saccharimonadales bacterium]|nr:exodeoxyribonuclease I [Candidatus Saccharimonadales bacterium]
MNKTSFFFYDLETSGLDPRRQRIMQFAGQRTDMDLNPVGEPINIHVRLSEEVLPDPGAILVTGITPQKTLEEGYTEAEFLRILHDDVFQPGTIMTGFNNVRFDDEYMRYTLYRNFYDPYEWSWQDGRSRWDVLDVVRMVRALRPDGINWPVTEDGHATNRLELLSSQNGVEHEHAHDALNDVLALIAVTKLLKEKQPKMYDYLLKLRDKKEVMQLVSLDDPQPFVYTSGRYPKGTLHTTVAYPLAPGSTPGSIIVYDLRHDPSDWAKMSIDDLKKIRFANWDQRQMEGFVPLPAKELAYNKCPAVAPVGVLDEATQQRLKLDMAMVARNLSALRHGDLANKLQQVFARDATAFSKSTDPDAQLYDGFVADGDKPKMGAVRSASANDLADFDPGFKDERLAQLLVRYKARNFPQSLSDTERATWEEYRSGRLHAELPKYMEQLAHLSAQAQTTDTHFLLSELQLWAESIAPAGD